MPLADVLLISQCWVSGVNGKIKYTYQNVRCSMQPNEGQVCFNKRFIDVAVMDGSCKQNDEVISHIRSWIIYAYVLYLANDEGMHLNCRELVIHEHENI